MVMGSKETSRCFIRIEARARWFRVARMRKRDSSLVLRISSATGGVKNHHVYRDSL